jgi:NAD+ kinase
MRIAFVASDKPDARAALAGMQARYTHVPVDEAEIVVALGGDGLMLECLHSAIGRNQCIYGMNFGSVGFLMNPYAEDNLLERLSTAERAVIHPLAMTTMDTAGRVHKALAINEVALLRQTHQTAKIRIDVDGQTRLAELICDGVMVATPAGSTAYNFSAQGPILPLGAQLLSLTTISAFRPRRWRGALLPHDVQVRFEIIEPGLRPVSATADSREVRDVARVEIVERRDINLHMLFDAGQTLSERIITEQFAH